MSMYNALWLMQAKSFKKKLQPAYSHNQYVGHLLLNIVKPVYKGHTREPENVAFMSSCPLYTG